MREQDLIEEGVRQLRAKVHRDVHVWERTKPNCWCGTCIELGLAKTPLETFNQWWKEKAEPTT